MESDNVRIKLPQGYALDSADSPGPFASKDVMSYDVKMMVEGKSEALIYQRNFKFSALIFPTTSYAGVKQIFDFVHERDNHTITLKQTATN